MKNAAFDRIRRLLSFVALVGLSTSAVPAGVNVWTTNGPTGQHIRALAIDPAQRATLYAGTYGGGVFKSTDSGGTWNAANTGLTNLFVFSLAIDPVSSATLYAGTHGGGVFKSTDSGRTWASASTGLRNLNVQALVIDPTASATLYAGTFEGGVFKSTDSGATWVAVNTGLGNPYVETLAIDPGAPATLYAGTIGPSVFKSQDSGRTWAATGLTDPWGYGSAYALAVNPAPDSTLYAGTDYGLFKTTDGGPSWTDITTDLTSTVVALAIDPANPATIYAGTYGAGVFKSTNAGDAWTAFNDGLGNLNVSALVVDPSMPGRIYAGTGNGVYEYQTIELTPIDRRILPVVGSTAGAKGTFFRTSVQLHNPESATMTGRIVFHPSGISGTDTDPALPYSLAPGQTLSIADLLPARGVSGLGSADIEIIAGSAPVATARVFNDAGPAGTTGFTERAMQAEEALQAGVPGLLLIPPDLTVARFNLGVRTLQEGASVYFTVRNAAGQVLGVSTRAFPHDYHEQQDALRFLRIFELPPGGSIEMSVASGAAIVYGATVDNRTGDPSLQLPNWPYWDY